MNRSEKRTENAATVEARTGPRGGGEGRRDLFSLVDEIFESVLDAADEEILADLGDQLGERALGGELLAEMMLDFLRRYAAKRRPSLAVASAGVGS